MKVVRFIDYNGAKSFLSENSTFKLASCQHYRILEESQGDKIFGDKRESIVGRNEFEAKSSLISCWNICENDIIDWNIFLGSTRGIAVVSTLEKVCCFLEGLKDSIGMGTMIFDHGIVEYYDPDDEELPAEFDICRSMFWKRTKYTNQKEYRFALLGGGRAISSLFFYAESGAVLKMIDEIHFGIDLCVYNVKTLLGGAYQLSDNGGPNALAKVHDFDRVIAR